MNRFKKPHVRILSVGDGRTAGAKEGFLASDWLPLFQKGTSTTELQLKANIRDIPADIIVNPLMEVYPETDLANQTSLKALTEFMEQGGVVICSGGLPFFWIIDYQEVTRGIKSFTGSFLDMYFGSLFSIEPVEAPSIVRLSMSRTQDPRLASLLDTWLYKTFGVMTTLGDPQDVTLLSVNDPYFRDLLTETTKVKEFRSPFRCDSRNAKLIPIVKASWQFDTHFIECYPIAAIKHGIGYLLVFAMQLENKNKKLIADTLASVLKKLKEKGCLD